MSSHGAGTARQRDALGGRCIPGERIDELVARLLSFDGRFPGIEPAAVLSLAEQALLEGVGRSAARPGAAPEAFSGRVAQVAVYPYGRPWFGLSAPPAGETQPVGWAPVDEQAWRVVTARNAILRQLRDQGDDEVERFFAGLGAGELHALLARAADTIDHNDPVLLYVDDELFTNFDQYNNLFPRQGSQPAPHHQLAHLLASPDPTLTRGQRRLCFGLHVVLRAGLRAEEFCGRQLTPWSLRGYFAHKYAQYHALGHPSVAPRPPDLCAQADDLARIKREVSRTHHPYRWINGIDFRKEERWRVQDSNPTLGIDAGLRDYCQEHFGTSGLLATSRDAHFLAVVEAMGTLAQDGRSGALGALVERVVRAAMDAIPSHVGMTRGMRDLAHFQEAVASGREHELCEAPLDDGFCAVFARPDFADLCSPQPVSRVLGAVSRRMQFNHWHYTPGYFGPAARAPDRHFYYPPTTADVATAEEHRHAGHALARVRHSIRAPAALRVAGRVFPGLVDIRLMRAAGRPYTEADLAAAADYADLLRALAQAVLDVAARGLPTPVVRGFCRDHYERQYPRCEGSLGPLAAVGPVRGPADSVGAMVRAALRVHAGSAAITCAASGRVFGAGMVERAAANLAGLLEPGERLALLCGDRANQALGVLAGLAAGLVVCPLDPAAPVEALSRTLRHLGPRAVLVDGGSPAVTLAERVPLDSLLGPARPSAYGVGRDMEGLVIYTSGTTGVPRGVPLGGAEVGANVAFAQRHFGYDAAWTSACLLPLHHSFALVSDLLPVFCAGGTVVMLPGFSPGQVATVGKVLAQHRVRSYSAVPLVLDTLVATGARLPSSLRFAISGAAALSERTRLRYGERHGHPVLPCYGLTESVCFATASSPGGVRPGASGRAAGIEVRVVGGDLQAVAHGERGEIALRGASVLTGGYLGHQGPPEECFADDGWFLTGDLGHLDDGGFLHVTGRSKDVVVRGGDKLYLADLDRCLLSLPGVTEACSARAPGFGGIERAVAFLVGRRTPDEIVRARALVALGPVGVPDEIAWVQRVPRSATGKPLREALLRQHRERA